MKISFAGIITVLVSFALGFFARDIIEPQDGVVPANASLASSALDHSILESGAAADATTARLSSDVLEVDAFNAVADTEKVASGPRRQARRFSSLDTPQGRARRLEHMRAMLREFFRINGIHSEWGEQIIRELVELDIEMVARISEIEATLDPNAPGVASGAALFENKEFLRLEKERIAKKRSIFGAYYDAYLEYKSTYQHQSALNAFSSLLDTPLNVATREELLQILIEETPKSRGPSSSGLMSEEMGETLRYRLQSVLDRNEAVKRRARSYLTPGEFERFSKTLEIEAERLELSIKLMELSRE